MKKLRVLHSNLKAIYNYKKRNVVLSNLPTLLWVEPTNRCNLSCIMCPNKDIPKEQLGFMEWPVYAKIVDEAKEFASSAYLLLGGESLLHKDIYRMIRYSSERGLRPLLNTNGSTLTNPQNVRELLDSGVEHITFAVDGYDRQTYERIRVGASFDKTVGGILAFLEMKKAYKRRKPYVAITTLLVGLEDYEDVRQARHGFRRMFNGLPVDEFIEKTPNTWGGIYKGAKEFKHHEIDEKGQFYPCGHLWSTMSIHWDGTVVPCCFDFSKAYTLGNVQEKTLREIWNDEPMLRLRRSMLDGSYRLVNKLCDGCVVLGLAPVLGVPVGLRAAVADAITNVIGFQAEKLMIRIAKKITPSFSLDVQE